jgi:hypothetical protein
MSLLSSRQFPIQSRVEDTITIRPTSSALFGVDSADRYASIQASAEGTQSPYRFTIVKNQALFNGFFNRIALTEIVFPYYIPNINERTSQIIVNGNTITIPALGFYTQDQLAQALEFGIFATGISLNVIYQYGRFVFTTNDGSTLTFARGNFGGTGARLDQFQLFDLLNMGPINTVASSSHRTGITNVQYTEYVDIVSSQLTYNQSLKDASSDPIVRDVLARVYIESVNADTLGRPTIIYRQFSTPKQIKWDPTQPLGNVSFEVFDDKGELLSAHLGAQFPDYTMPDWRITLLFSES